MLHLQLCEGLASLFCHLHFSLHAHQLLLQQQGILLLLTATTSNANMSQVTSVTKKSIKTSLKMLRSGGGGFFLASKIWGECATIHFLSAFFFFLVEIDSCTLIPLFTPGSVHSGSVS